MAVANLVSKDLNPKNVNLLNVNENIAKGFEDLANKFEPLSNNSINSDKIFYGSKHPYYTNKLINFAFSYLRKDNYEKAETTFNSGKRQPERSDQSNL